MLLRIGLLLTVLLSVAAPAHAADFAFETWFAGKSRATGSFRAINGVKRTFEVALNGKWDGRTLTLREDFVYDDGERDTKTWRFVKTGKGAYTGTREDVVGATKVIIKGDTARFSYKVYLDGKNRKNLVSFSDVMRLGKDGRVINTAIVSKFGIPVARTRVVFSR